MNDNFQFISITDQFFLMCSNLVQHVMNRVEYVKFMVVGLGITPKVEQCNFRHNINVSEYYMRGVCFKLFE